MKSDKSNTHQPLLLDLVTMNEKGQVVIPADARALINLRAGDKMLIMMHPSKEGLILIKPDGLEKYAKQMLEKLSDIKSDN
jgi:AbrB family looped-hinge helix DNA binding protein